MALALRPLLTAVLLPLSTALTWSRCAQEGTFEFALTALSATSEPVVPGQRLCIEWTASPTIALAGVTLQVEHNFSTGGFREIGVCDSLRGDRKCPVSAGQKLFGSVCGELPLSTMVYAGRTLPLTLRTRVNDGESIGCWAAHVQVATTITTDVLLEPSVPHHELHRVVYSSANVAVEEQDDVDELGGAAALRAKLNAAYQALPEWAEAFQIWRQTHKREYLRRVEPSAEAAESPPDLEVAAAAEAFSEAAVEAALREEAKGFLAFRENVLSAVRNGRRLEFDRHTDKRRDARATLQHFA